MCQRIDNRIAHPVIMSFNPLAHIRLLVNELRCPDKVVDSTAVEFLRQCLLLLLLFAGQVSGAWGCIGGLNVDTDRAKIGLVWRVGGGGVQ